MDDCRLGRWKRELGRLSPVINLQLMYVHVHVLSTCFNLTLVPAENLRSVSTIVIIILPVFQFHINLRTFHHFCRLHQPFVRKRNALLIVGLASVANSLKGKGRERETVELRGVRHLADLLQHGNELGERDAAR